MKNKSFILPTIVLLWIIFIFASPAQQKARWKGTIEKIDGVTVIKSPKEPMYGEDVFDPDGKYVAKIPLKSRPYVIKKGKLYTIEEDKEGYQLVKRYGVSWKN